MSRSSGFSLAVLLAEKARRDEARAQQAVEAPRFEERYAELAGRLRAEYHPKQRAFCRSPAKRKAAKCTRRAGKTRGGCRESMARALERPRFRGIYCHATRAEAKRLAWRGDTRDGWRDLIEQLGLRVARSRDEFDRNPNTDVLVNEGDLTIDFRNGSQLTIFAFDRAEDSDKIRGGEKDLVWIDEAQLLGGLRYFIEEVATGLVAKPGGNGGEIWMTGTPARSLSGMFFDVTKEFDDPAQGEREPGWEVHEFAVTDNPYFGATAEERWEATAGEVLREKNWDPKNPPPKFVREWLGRWTRLDALYVYAVHAAAPHIFAPSRVDVLTGAYDHALAMRDLPPFVLDEDGRQEEIHWYFALGVDFGFRPDPFAWVLWAFSPQIADIYEMGSWKQVELVPDAMRDHLRRLWDAAGGALISLRGDAGGAMANATIEGWRESMNMPIEAADKHDKATWQELFNGELFGKRIHYRQSSLLLAEQRELQWRITKAGKRLEWADRVVKDPRTGEESKPGNHCSDAGLYSYRDLVARRIEFDAPPQTEEERDRRQARALIRSMERAAEPADPYGGE